MPNYQSKHTIYITLLAALLWSHASTAMPANDDISNAVSITSIPTVINLAVNEATQTAAEPSPSCSDSATASVWYRYAATETAAVHIHTFNSRYDTVLSVWTGSPDNLQEVVCNDDDNGTLQSRVKLDAQANITYYLNISGIDIVQPNLQLTVTPIAALTNDDIATALRILPANAEGFQQIQTVQSATVTFGETLPTCSESNALNKSVWFRYRSNREQRVVFSTFGSSYDTVLAVWTGDSRALTEVACDDDGANAQAQLSLDLAENTIYYVSISEKTTGSIGNTDNVLVFSLNTPAENDDLAAAVSIAALPFVTTQDSGGASLEPQEQRPSCNSDIGSSVWFRLPANIATGDTTFFTTNINFDSVLSVWQGDAHPLTEVACNDNSTALDQSTEAQLSLRLLPDVSYYVNVATGNGQFELHIAPAVRDFSIAQAPPARTVVAGQSATLSVILRNAEGTVLENGPDVNNQWVTLVTVPFTYQWYIGATGDTSRPVAGNDYQLLTPPLEETTQFWVRVSNATGTADSAATTVEVIPVPDFPVDSNTPNGVGINAAGEALATQAHFSGLITVVEGDSGNPLAASQQDTLAIVASIQVDPAHVGQTADIAMVAQYIAADSALFYHRQPTNDDTQIWDFWDGGIPTLSAVQTGITLMDRHDNIPIFVGQLQGLPGQFRVFIGYRLLTSGAVFYNGIPIELTISP